MIKQLYIIRHGQTDFNRRGIVQGSGVDAPLNELGLAQARSFYEAFKHVRFDKVYVSELKRTHQSVAQFMERFPYEKHGALNEISWGVYEGREVGPTDKVAFRSLIDQWEQGQLDLAFEEGESPQQVFDRQREFMPKLRDNSKEKNVLICMHGRAMRVFLCQLLNLPLTRMDEFEHQNLCLYHLEMDEKGKFSLVKRNYTDHLSYL